MKKIFRVFAVILLLFNLNIQAVDAQSNIQSRIGTFLKGSKMRSFFCSQDNLPYRTICRLAHPTNTFERGLMEMNGNNIDVTIISRDGSGLYTLKLRLYKSGNRFESLSVISDDDFPAAFTVANIIKVVANELLADYHSDTIANIESLYGERLRDMDAKKLVLAALTLLLWEYNV